MVVCVGDHQRFAILGKTKALDFRIRFAIGIKDQFGKRPVGGNKVDTDFGDGIARDDNPAIWIDGISVKGPVDIEVFELVVGGI